jgi:hypothetical protein
MIEVAISAIILCNNLNWEYSERCIAPVESFYETTTGFEGQLTSGVKFTQERITSSLQLFKMENVCWLTNGVTTVYCDL